MKTASAALLLLLCAPVARAQPAGGGFAVRLVAAAREQTTHAVRYDGAYRRIPYPGGDVPKDIGVCSDVVVRAYRVLGIDLQRRVHEDMARNFAAYPKQWGLRAPDPNIDHRRVPNLQAFLRRRGAQRPVSQDGASYAAGDLVTWMLPGNLPHIGIVSDVIATPGGSGAQPRSGVSPRGSRAGIHSRREPPNAGSRPLILHNIGQGPQEEDALFTYPITGHYRWQGE